MVLLNSDAFQFWLFPILTLSNSNSFQFWHFPVLTLSIFFQFQHFSISDTIWHFSTLTFGFTSELKVKLKRRMNFFCIEYFSCISRHIFSFPSSRFEDECYIYNSDSHDWDLLAKMRRKRAWYGMVQLNESAFWITGKQDYTIWSIMWGFVF